MGSESIHPGVLRELADVIVKLLSLIFEKMIKKKKKSEDWGISQKKDNVTPIYRKDLKEYPGIHQFYFSPWESYGTNPPGGYHKSNEVSV